MTSRARPPERRLVIRFAVMGLAMAVVLAGGIWLLWPRPQPQDLAATPPTRPSIPILVSAGVGGQRKTVSAHPGQVLQVTGHALGSSGISALELWDGTNRVAVDAEDSPLPAAHALWQWTAGDPGEHVLVVRAVDSSGRVAQADPILVSVGGEAVGQLHGDTVLASSPAPHYAVTLPQASASVSGCAATVKVTAAADPSVSGFGFVGLAPDTGHFVPLGTMGAHPADGAETFTVPLTAGRTTLTVTSFNASAEAYGPPMLVTAPASCESTTGWSGSLRLQDGKLLPAPSVERAYLYVSQDGGASQRVPADPSRFVSPANGVFDFSPYLPAITGTGLHLEAWGRTGDTLTRLGTGDWTRPPARAAAPGQGQAVAGWNLAAPAATAISSDLGVLVPTVMGREASNGACTVEICTIDVPQDHDELHRPAAGDGGPVERRFQWSTRLVGVTGLVWQILPYPTVATADLSPPFLLGSGLVPVTTAASSGTFSIDFRPYLVPGPMSADVGDLSASTAHLIASVFGSTSTTTATPAPTASPTPATGGGVVVGNLSGQLAGLDAQLSGNLLGRGLGLLGYTGRLYVRVIPIAEGALGQPTPPVILDVTDPVPDLNLPAPENPPDPGSYDIKVSITPPKAPDPHYARCSIVTKLTGDFQDSMATRMFDVRGHYASHQPYCYSPPDDGWSLTDAFDAFVDFVADVWDAVSDAWKWIEAKIVDVVLTLVPCKEIASDSTCEAIATTALQAVAASFGIPPSLPNFEQLVQAAKGNLADFIVSAAQSLPGVSAACGLADAANTVTSKVKDCKDLANAAIDEAVSHLLAARSNAAAQAAGTPAFPGEELAPDPRGVWQAPSVTFTVTRTNDPYAPKDCTLSASLKSKLDNWTYTEIHDGYPKDVTSSVSGSPFVPASAPIPELQPGQSYTGTLWLTQPSHWIESTQALVYLQELEPGASTDHSWVLLQQGAKLTFDVTSQCTPEVTQNMTLAQSGVNG